MLKPSPTQKIPLERIHNPPDHNRPIDKKHVHFLAAEIKRHGLQHPITVIPNDDEFDVVAGLHRLEACRELDYTEIECKLLDASTSKAELIEISIAENRVRKNETFSETVARIERIMKLKGCSFSEAARQSSVGKAFASKCLKIERNLYPNAKQLVSENPEKLGISIAYEVARFATSEAQQMEALRAILDGHLTRDELVRTLKQTGSAKPKKIKLQLVIDGVAINLGIPKTVEYEKLLSILGTLKAKLLAEMKHGTPIHILPEILN